MFNSTCTIKALYYLDLKRIPNERNDLYTLTQIDFESWAERFENGLREKIGKNVSFMLTVYIYLDLSTSWVIELRKMFAANERS